MGPTSCRNRRCPAAWRWPAIGRPMIPRPMKPTSIIGILLPRRLCVDRLGRVPPEAFDGGCFRLVFAANPAAISHLVEMPEQKRIADLSGARFVAAGIVG